LVLWIRNALSPQEIRDRLLGGDSEFQRRLIEYLEAAHTGDYFTGTQDQVKEDRFRSSLKEDYTDPTENLPEPPPQACPCVDEQCVQCKQNDSWWQYFRKMVDHIICTVNVHKCSAAKGCKDNKWGRCRGRFPRSLFSVTTVDSTTGHVDMKKSEAWINTFTPILTYLFRCNTDVTSLRSGTAIKAVLIYVSDYITKPSLKTHVFFDVVKSVFQKSK
ncbi:hypothetical protein EV421DRAFT_1686130, partial [Armillaria borealis]